MRPRLFVNRILIADDHEMIRHGLRKVLEEHPDWAVCGEAVNGREAVGLAKRLRPDVVVLDFAMPELNGLEATRQILAALPRTKVLILTMYDSDELAREALAAGARGFVTKNDAGRVLVTAIEQLIQHRPFFTSGVARRMGKGWLSPSAPVGNKPRPPLTAREREIVQLVAEGKSTKEVAALLNISVKTAETHRVNLMRKLDLHSVGELVRYAIRNHIVQP